MTARPTPETARLLAGIGGARSAHCPRQRRGKRWHFSRLQLRASNARRANGSAFLDHDDILEPDALFQNVKWLQDHPDADLIYSDEDKLTEQGFDAPHLQTRLVAGLFSLLQLPLPFHHWCGASSCEEAGRLPFRVRWRPGLRSFSSHHRTHEPHPSHCRACFIIGGEAPTSTADNIRRKPRFARDRPAGGRSASRATAASPAMSRSIGGPTPIGSNAS